MAGQSTDRDFRLSVLTEAVKYHQAKPQAKAEAVLQVYREFLAEVLKEEG